MQLRSIDLGPEPTRAQINRQLRQSSFGNSLPKRLQRPWAAFEWRFEKQKKDPNTYLVGFAPNGYEDYLVTAQWRRISTRILKENNYTCVCCSGRATEVHHRDYRPRVLSGDDTTPLVPICRGCHKIVEKAKLVSWNEGERVLAQFVRSNNKARRKHK